MSKLYVSDIDGTLTDNSGNLSPATKRGLIELLEQGVLFTVASARSIVSIRDIMRDIPFNLPIICINGAYLSELHSSSPSHLNCLSTQVYETLIDQLTASGFDPFVLSLSEREHLSFRDLKNSGQRWFYDERIQVRDPRLNSIDSYASLVSHQILGVTIVDEREAIMRVRADLQQRFGEELELHAFENLYSPGWYWLTIHSRDACKSIAIAQLASQLQIPMQDVVVFGDHVNDVKMFKSAGWSVAVSNAIDEVKHAADEVIAANTDDAVIRYLRSVI